MELKFIDIFFLLAFTMTKRGLPDTFPFTAYSLFLVAGAADLMVGLGHVVIIIIIIIIT